MHVEPGRPRAAHGRLDAILACGLVAVCALVVAVLAWTRPASSESVLHYTQSGRLAYTAPVPRDSVYGAARVRSGQPVYTSTVRALRLTYTYHFGTALPAVLTGTEQLVATIDNGEGISRRVPLQARRSFAGRDTIIHATLRLSDLQAAAAAFDQAAGGYTQGTYAVRIEPSVHVKGTLAGAPLSASLTDPVAFTFGAGAFVPTASTQASTPPVTTSGPPPPAAPKLGTIDEGTLTAPVRAAAQLFPHVSVRAARIGSLALLAATLLAAALLGRRLLAGIVSNDEAVRIAARHGLSLVATRALPHGPRIAIVEVGSFQGLLQVARRLECPILHRSDGGDVYAVVDNGTLYRYRSFAALLEDEDAPPRELSGLNGHAANGTRAVAEVTAS